MKHSIKINAILNVIKYSLSVLFPLITYPYAIRVLGADGVGKVSYSNSIISYFSLIALFGITNYGIREGAKYKSNRSQFNNIASELFSFNVITTIIAFILLLIVIFFVEPLSDYRMLLLIQSLTLVFTTFGIDWINSIYEDYYYITIRSIFVQIASIILLFITVKSKDDYYNYALLSVFTNGIVCILNWFYCKKYVRIHFVLSYRVLSHFKPMFIFFVNSLMMMIYVNVDMTMLGWMKGDYEVGVYTVAVKVYGIMKNIMVAVYMVSIPRLSLYLFKNQINSYQKLFSDICCTVLLILLPVSVGIACVSEEIMVFMGGNSFHGTAMVLQILSVSLIFAILGGITTSVLNITMGREKDNLYATVFSAIINFTLNLIVIPYFSYFGAALTTAISELFVFVFCFARFPEKNQFIDFKKLRNTLKHTVFGVILIILLSLLIKQIIPFSIIRTLIIVIGGIILYVTALMLTHDQYFLEILHTIYKHLYKK